MVVSRTALEEMPPTCRECFLLCTLPGVRVRGEECPKQECNSERHTKCPLMEIPEIDAGDVMIVLQKEDAENLLRLLGKLNFYRIGAALSDNPALQEWDVDQTAKSVARAYKAFDDVVGLKWRAVAEERGGENGIL